VCTAKDEPSALTVWIVAREDATGGFWARAGVTTRTSARRTVADEVRTLDIGSPGDARVGAAFASDSGQKAIESQGRRLVFCDERSSRARDEGDE
jgi:hypothetical protein